MATSLHTTMDSAWSMLHKSLPNFNLSFAGFSTEDIFGDSKWRIEPKSLSTTISVNPIHYDSLISELTNLYGEPENKGKQHGRIFRCSELSVTITCYNSTNTISVQGTLHNTWVELNLQEIDQLIDQKNVDEQSKDSTDDEVIFASGLPITSTPDQSFLVPSTRTIATQTYQSTESTICQTEIFLDETPKLKDTIASLKDRVKDLKEQLNELREIRSNHTQLTHAYREMTERNAILEAKKRSLETSETFQHVQHSSPPRSAPASKTDPTSTSRVSPNTVSATEEPTIPVNNRFTALPCESTIAISEAEPKSQDQKCLKPTPKPRKTLKPVPKPRKLMKQGVRNTTTNSNPPSLKPEPTRTQSEKPFQNGHSKRKVLILGDSITKGLVGRKMSRQCIIKNRSISGTTIQNWIRLAPIFIEEENPDIVILHCGTNNIHMITDEAVSLMQQLVDAVLLVKPQITICISSLTAQLTKNGQYHSGHNAWINEFNARTLNMCHSRNCGYIGNFNILAKHLAVDGIHMKPNGTIQLAQNIITFLKFKTGFA